MSRAVQNGHICARLSRSLAAIGLLLCSTSGRHEIGVSPGDDKYGEPLEAGFLQRVSDVIFSAALPGVLPDRSSGTGRRHGCRT